MKLCNILIQYSFLIYYSFCHDLNHADPVTVKSTESTVPIDPLNKTIETTNVQTEEGGNVHLRATDDSNHAHTTPSVDIPSPSQIPVSIQTDTTSSSSTPPSITDRAQIIPISDELSPSGQIPINSQPVKNIQEQNSFTHPKSHIPSNPTPTTTQDTTIVQNDSQPSKLKHPQLAHIHPRHIPTEEKIITDVNQAEKTTEQTVLLENKTQLNAKEDLRKNETESVTTTPSTSLPDINPHLPRISENSSQATDQNNTETNHSISIPTDRDRQICWHLPKKFQPSIELLENQLFRLINILPDFLQTIFFGRIDDREVLMNTMWFGSICTMCALFSFLFLSMGTKRLKQSKDEKEVRSRCQQLQQHNNQIQLERATIERQNQKLSEQIDELKLLSVRDTDEDIFALRTECMRFEEDMKTARMERDTLQQDIDRKQNLIQKYEYDMKGQGETLTYLNNQILQLRQELEKERTNIHRLQSADLSFEQFEKSQTIIQQLKSELTQLKQEKFADKDQLQEIREHAKQLDTNNHQLTTRMKQLKDLLEQRDQTIKRLHQTIQTIDHFESEELLAIFNENSSDNNLLSNVNEDINKSNQHIHDLHSEIEDKTRHIKEIEILLKQEKDHCREMETKLKVVLELRERDAHLHIRQLGQTDAELRKARTDTDRVRILQQQLELKQQQFDDIQKVLSSDQAKFNEECSKLQHESHEKWMEVKRLMRELDASKKECESLRRQITKYANGERSSQEKMMIKPIPQHFGNAEMNSISPISYQQGENFRPIGDQRNDSGTTSPAEMFIPRPPLFGLSRPPFFPASFMPPPPNPFMMHPRFPMPTPGLHGMISPIPHLIINGNDGNNSEMIDSSNLTPNSMNYDAQSNEAASSPASNDEKQNKSRKAKKSSKKKPRTSAVKEEV